MVAGMAFGNDAPDVSPYADESPYGTPVVKSEKAGLTRRGKVAVAVAGVALVGGGTIWFQVHSAAVAKDEKEAAALQIQMKQLELEEMRIRNAQASSDQKAATASAEKVQAAVDKCVKDSFALADKGYGPPSRSAVVADCKQQYETVDGSLMTAASNVQAAGRGAGGAGSEGINSPTLLGLVAGGGLAIAVFARKGKKADA
ncbi:hypothetical protein AAW14_37955 [Streptomyces hygroscopicus]|uniref:Uncharacterized protein n=1 Tax=Streptomyces showdoensis TaxID=68268 RepID=A0A2P2GKL3_STREW|nr:hypothetical protein [Streptomyces hygroscopicus]KKZ72052.1 hypothetical protein VO63_19890 [Streptomyces showdoensis]MCW7947530.1 hypothetical protein [Streptomyces hygroscopicus]